MVSWKNREKKGIVGPEGMRRWANEMTDFDYLSLLLYLYICSISVESSISRSSSFVLRLQSIIVLFNIDPMIIVIREIEKWEYFYPRSAPNFRSPTKEKPLSKVWRRGNGKAMQRWRSEERKDTYETWVEHIEIVKQQPVDNTDP